MYYNMNYAQIIDGRKYASDLLSTVKERVLYLNNKYKITPRVDVILVGNRPDSATYVRLKEKKAKEVGILFNLHKFNDISEAELINLIEKLNNDIDVNGILVQLPLPKHIDEFKVVNKVSSTKDVDGFTIHNVGLLNLWKPSFTPCTPQGVVILIKKVLGNNITGKKAVVVGRSIVVGRPLSSMLIQENCTVTLAHSFTKNLQDECNKADILVVAAGKAKLIQGSYIKPGACVIDVGMNYDDNNQLCGDVNFDEAVKVAKYITPVPGGVGPMTIACLMSNTLKALAIQSKVDFCADH